MKIVTGRCFKRGPKYIKRKDEEKPAECWQLKVIVERINDNAESWSFLSKISVVLTEAETDYKLALGPL